MTDSIAIIGMGASGLMAGSILGLEAFCIEKNSVEGKKLLSTGQGKCNFTHAMDEKDLIEHYYEASRFVKNAIYAFPPKKIISYFDSLGVPSVTLENGKVFPKSMNASDIRNALSGRCGKIFYCQEVVSLEKKDGIFFIKTDKDLFKARYVIVATGGVSAPRTGSDGRMLSLLSSMGHSITPLYPTLCPIRLERPFSKAEGISLPIKIKAGKREMTDSAVITKDGISGPLAENFAHFLTPGMTVSLSFIEMDAQGIKKLKQREMLKNALALPDRLVSALFGLLAEKRVADLNKEELQLIANTLSSQTTKAWAMKEGAMSNRGGVDRKEIDPATMESKIVENLFITGEAADVDAMCGGYSLTWAFSSAFLAAKAIREKKEKQRKN